jgi:hypothetical protein
LSRFPLGAPVRQSTTVRQLNVDGTTTLVTPTTLTLLVKLAQADGTWLTTGTYASPAQDSTGTYHQDVPAADLTAIGHYQYTWTSTGPGAGVAVGDFDVYDPFEVRVLSLQDAKDMLNIPQATAAYDAEVDGWVAAIESGLERFTGGPVVNRSVSERCEALNGLRQFCVRQRPLVSVTSIIAETGGALGLSDVRIDANAGTIQRAMGWPFLGPFAGPWFTVTYTAGWGTSVPPAFASFARIVIDHLWGTQRGPSQRPSMGGDETVTPPGWGFAIPNRALELLNGSQDGISFACEAYV